MVDVEQENGKDINQFRRIWVEKNTTEPLVSVVH